MAISLVDGTPPYKEDKIFSKREEIMKPLILFFALWLPLLFTSSNLSFGDEPVENLPGYVDFSPLKEFQEENSVEVNLKGSFLSIATKAACKETPQLSGLLSGLKLVQVHIYSLKTPKSGMIKKRANKIALDLQKKGWERIVKTKEKEEKSEIYVKTAEDKIAGLAIFSIDEGDEAVFVNLVGGIDPDFLNKVGTNLHFLGIDSLKAKAAGQK